MIKYPVVCGNILVGGVIFLGITATQLGAQSRLPEWKLSPPRIVFGIDDIDLHRVRGAQLMPGGRVAIADAGNARIVLFAGNGKVEKTIGRAGSGPGDFRGLTDIAVFGDTLLAYDGMLNKVSRWRADGTLVDASQLPSVEERPMGLRAFVSPNELLLTSMANHLGGRTGLYLDSVNLYRYDLGTRQLNKLDILAWSYAFIYVQDGGVTSYATPFLGSANVAAGGARIAQSGLTGARINILDSSGAVETSVALPEVTRRFDPAMVTRYRDSLLAVSRAMGDRSQRTTERIGAVFGKTFPSPEQVSTVQKMRTVGNEVWIRVFGAGAGGMSRWYVLLPAQGRLVARVALPGDWDVLGGESGKVLILRRDDLGVETVGLFEVLKP